MAQVPTIIADLHRIRNGLPVLSPDPGFGLSANFLYMLRGTPPSQLESEAMRELMVLHADHELNASTFAARVIASTLSDMHSALAGAIAALKGSLHGGANQRVMEMILDIPDPEMVQSYIAGMLENKKRIMGFGHRVYRTEDPRTPHLRKYSEQLCSEGAAHHYEISRRIEQAVMDAKGIYPNVDFYSARCNIRWISHRNTPHRTGGDGPKGIYPNVDFYSATVQHAMGIPPEYFTTVFAASHRGLDRPHHGAIRRQPADPAHLAIHGRDGPAVRADQSARLIDEA